MKEGWEYKPAGEIFDITDYVSNGSFASLRENVKYLDHPDYAVLIRLADYSNGFDKKNFVYVSKQSYEFLAKSKLFGGEIIMSNVGSIGKSFLCPKLDCPMTIGPNAILIRSGNNRFFLYYFQSEDFNKKLLSISSRATLKKFNKTNFKTLSIPVPPLSEQQQIVEYLDAQFEKIDALKANAETQLQAAKDLFQSTLKDLLTPKEGWKMTSIGKIFKSYSGGTPLKSKQEYYNNATIPWLNSGEVCQKYITNTNNYISELGLKNSSAKFFPINTVLIAMYGATAAQAGILKFEATTNQAICGLLPIKEMVPEFVYYWFLYNKTEFAAMAQGGAQPNLSQVKIKSMPIPQISIEQQKIICDKLESYETKVKSLLVNYEQTITLCNDLKQSLLKKVFE